MYACAPLAGLLPHGGWKGALEPLKQELQKVMSHHAGAWD